MYVHCTSVSVCAEHFYGITCRCKNSAWCEQRRNKKKTLNKADRVIKHSGSSQKQYKNQLHELFLQKWSWKRMHAECLCMHAPDILLNDKMNGSQWVTSNMDFCLWRWAEHLHQRGCTHRERMQVASPLNHYTIWQKHKYTAHSAHTIYIWIYTTACCMYVRILCVYKTVFHAHCTLDPLCRN